VPDLSPDQRGVLLDLGDLGMRAAARALDELLGAGAAVSLSPVEAVERAAVPGLVPVDEGPVVGVGFVLSGLATGRFAVLIPHGAALALVATLEGHPGSPQGDPTDEEWSTLKEVGNILGSACVSAVANRLRIWILLSVPHLVVGRTEAVLAAALPPADGGAICAARFAAAARGIEGVILLAPDGALMDLAPAPGGAGARSGGA
jgi:chemotaxis protein CheC